MVTDNNDISIKKTESLNFESYNENLLKNLENKLEELTKEKKNIVANLNELSNEIKDMNQDLEVLDNYEKYYDLTERLKKLIENENNNNSNEKKKIIKKKESNSNFDMKVFEIRNNLQVEN